MAEELGLEICRQGEYLAGDGGGRHGLKDEEDEVVEEEEEESMSLRTKLPVVELSPCLTSVLGILRYSS
jgi:hypothetical protein